MEIDLNQLEAGQPHWLSAHRKQSEQANMAQSETWHTPGPWIPQGQWATDKGIAEVVEAKGLGIIGAWIDKSNEPHGNRDLILAAPDLLKACKRMLRCHEEGWKRLDFHPIDDIRAAIAKAEGGPHVST